MAEARAIKGTDLRLMGRRIRFGACWRDRLWDVVWLDFADPHTHLVVYVTVTSARTSSNVPAVGASLTLPCRLAMRAEQAY
jgi:hypothetical protein